MSTGVITTIVGTGTAGFGGDGSASTSAKLFWPSGLTFDSAGIFSFSRYFSTVSLPPSPQKMCTSLILGTTASARLQYPKLQSLPQSLLLGELSLHFYFSGSKCYFILTH